MFKCLTSALCKRSVKQSIHPEAKLSLIDSAEQIRVSLKARSDLNGLAKLLGCVTP
jgi:hypothetical protein